MIYTIFGGVNGVGKSTIYKLLKDEERKNLGVRINVDELVSSMGNWQDKSLQISASKTIVKNIKHCIDNKISFNQETTLAGNSIIQTIKRAKAKGFIINLNYVYVDNVEIAKQRVLDRVKNGGHGVSEKLIESRFTKSLENLKQLILLCDKIAIFNNTESLYVSAIIEDAKLTYIDKHTHQFIKDCITMV